MAKKNIIKTLQGKTLNMTELALRNEKTIPVGNLPKDHIVNPVNETVATKTRRPTKAGRRQRAKMAEDAPVMNSIKAAKIIAAKYLEDSAEDSVGIVVDAKPEPRYASPTGPAPKVVAKKVEPVAPIVKPEPAPLPPAPVEQKEEVSDEVLTKVVEQATKRPGGLANAIAKARQVKQEPLKTPRQEVREEPGVKKF